MSQARRLAKFKSVEQLEAMMSAALDDHGYGSSTTGWSIGDSSANKMAWANLPPAIRANDIGAALSIADPETYPPEDCISVTRTRVLFRDVNS